MGIILLSIMDRELVHVHWHIYQLYKCSLPTSEGTGILEKVCIECPCIVGKKEHLPCKLFNYFVLCSIFSENIISNFPKTTTTKSRISQITCFISISKFARFKKNRV